jgi:hypothetical protein
MTSANTFWKLCLPAVIKVQEIRLVEQLHVVYLDFLNSMVSVMLKLNNLKM